MSRDERSPIKYLRLDVILCAALVLVLSAPAPAVGQDDRPPAVRDLLARQPALRTLFDYLDAHPRAPADEIGQRLTEALFGMDLNSPTRSSNVGERLALLQLVASDDRIVAALSLPAERLRIDLARVNRVSPTELITMVDNSIQDIAAFIPPSPAAPVPARTAPASPGSGLPHPGRPRRGDEAPPGVWLVIGLTAGAALGIGGALVIRHATSRTVSDGQAQTPSLPERLGGAVAQGGGTAIEGVGPGSGKPMHGFPGSPGAARPGASAPARSGGGEGIWAGAGGGPVLYPGPGAPAGALLDALAGGKGPQQAAGQGVAGRVEARPTRMMATTGAPAGAAPLAGAPVGRADGPHQTTRLGVEGASQATATGDEQVREQSDADLKPAILRSADPVTEAVSGGGDGGELPSEHPVPAFWLDTGDEASGLSEADLLPSRYSIETVLGRGGMGVVYKAFDQKERRPVAIKLLPASEMGRQEARDRFLREFGVMMELNHPNIARVYDIGTDRVMYFVMELVDGKDVGTIVVEGILPVPMAVGLATQLADALAYAHSRTILHRDIKPSNLMVDSAARLKVIDFGLARLANAAPITLPGTVIGSFKFMSPEQLLAQSVDARSDLYAVGGTLYYMLTGQVPFEGRNPHVKINAAPRPILEVDPSLPAPLAKLVMACLERDPARRPQTAREVEKTLRSLAL